MFLGQWVTRHHWWIICWRQHGKFFTFDLLQSRYKYSGSAANQATYMNYGLCIRHLNQLKACLQKEPSLFKVYTFKVKWASGIIELVPLEATPSHFLPHHGVICEDKEMKKLRIVFDGSAKSDPKLFSLNDCQENRPNLTPLIFGVLLNIRWELLLISRKHFIRY